MRLFRRKHPDDVLYLMPVQLGNEQLPKDRIRMLYADVEGRVHTSVMERAEYDHARNNARKLKRSHKKYATIGLEISPDKQALLAVEVGIEEVWALEHILEHALRMGKLPDVLKKYPEQIIKLGESRRQELTAQHIPAEPGVFSGVTPQLLDRLPYYSENDIEASIPIYKAEYNYPLIILKWLPLNEHTPPSMQRLLIIDSDGDLAIIRVPRDVMDKAEKGFEAWKQVNEQEGCIICSQHPDGLSMSYLAISESQKRVLDTITKYFEETGHGKKPVSTAAQVILTRARDAESSPLSSGMKKES